MSKRTELVCTNRLLTMIANLVVYSKNAVMYDDQSYFLTHSDKKGNSQSGTAPYYFSQMSMIYNMLDVGGK